MKRALALILLAVALLPVGACLKQAAAPLSASSTSPGPQPVREESVLRGFDPASPAGSAAAIAVGGIRASRMEFDTLRVELGEIYQFDVIPFEYPFHVAGDEPIVVTVLDPNCGCADIRIRAEWDEGVELVDGEKRYVLGRPIPAGARGAVIGTFSAERRFGDKLTTIHVRGNFDGTPLKLELNTNIRRVFDVKPEQVRFGDVLAGTPGAAKPVELRVVASAPFQIKSWRRMPVGLAIAPIGGQEGTGFREEVAQSFRVTLGADAPEGVYSTSAIAETSLGKDLEIMVQANIVGPVRCTPVQRLSFGIWDQGEERVRTIDVESSVENVRLPTPSVVLEGEAARTMNAAVEVLEEGRFFRVKVTVPADAAVGSYPGVLRLVFPADSGFHDKEFVLSARVREKKA
jgi:hypothetical protein